MCQPGRQTSHFWGQYAPYFPVASTISPDVPKDCNITFAQVLSRHGARDPTLGKTIVYKITISKIKENIHSYTGKYAFLADYEYALGADELTLFGEQQMVDSGIDFYNRYQRQARHHQPFVRASGQNRVVISAQNFTQGFHQAKLADAGPRGKEKYPYPILTISEAPDSNNTLHHGLCTEFEDGAPYDTIAFVAQQAWLSTWLPLVTARLNTDLIGAGLVDADVIYLMDLCPFETVASPTGKTSPFCALFTDDEWHKYDYYQSLGKFYGYGKGNPLGPTQGVGFVNELIARMAHEPVRDETSVNHTLDDDSKTFPIGKETVLYADFSHDNDMTSAFFALGLYGDTQPLSNTTLQNTRETSGYSAAWTVPFAGRVYVEKMQCRGSDEELVRILVNGRVIRLQGCSADELGRCTLSKWLDSLSFARSGGEWGKCFV